MIKKFQLNKNVLFLKPAGVGAWCVHAGHYVGKMASYFLKLVLLLLDSRSPQGLGQGKGEHLSRQKWGCGGTAVPQTTDEAGHDEGPGRWPARPWKVERALSSVGGDQTKGP